MINEFIFSLGIYSYMYLTDFTDSIIEVKKIAGIGVIACVCLTFAINMGFMLIVSIIKLKSSIV